MTGDEVRRQRFGVVLRGYDLDAVDGALDHLAAKLDAGDRPLPADCESAFRIRLRGYDRDEVDQFLKRAYRATR